jgi:hypothetical protein
LPRRKLSQLRRVGRYWMGPGALFRVLDVAQDRPSGDRGHHHHPAADPVRSRDPVRDRVARAVEELLLIRLSDPGGHRLLGLGVLSEEALELRHLVRRLADSE